MSEKIYITSDELHRDSLLLAERILQSGFRPSSIIALWRGGTPIGIAVQEYLNHYGGFESDHIAIRTSSYGGIEQRSRTVQIHGLSYLLKNINREDQLLIVDDVFDTGHTIDALIDELRDKCRKNTPQDIRVAVPWYKPTRNQTDRVPDYYIHETERWLKFPFSLEGLTVDEIRDNRPAIYAILEDVLPKA
jgi:uncharacterized protein